MLQVGIIATKPCAGSEGQCLFQANAPLCLALASAFQAAFGAPGFRWLGLLGCLASACARREGGVVLHQSSCRAGQMQLAV